MGSRKGPPTSCSFPSDFLVLVGSLCCSIPMPSQAVEAHFYGLQNQSSHIPMSPEKQFQCWLVASLVSEPMVTPSKLREPTQWSPSSELCKLASQLLNCNRCSCFLISPRDGSCFLQLRLLIPSCSHCPTSSCLVHKSPYLANSFSMKFSLLNSDVSSLSWKEWDHKMESKGFTESRFERSEGVSHTAMGKTARWTGSSAKALGSVWYLRGITREPCSGQ